MASGAVTVTNQTELESAINSSSYGTTYQIDIGANFDISSTINIPAGKDITIQSKDGESHTLKQANAAFGAKIFSMTEAGTLSTLTLHDITLKGTNSPSAISNTVGQSVLVYVTHGTLNVGSGAVLRDQNNYWDGSTTSTNGGGGAICANGANAIVNILQGSLITGNRATRGGGIAILAGARLDISGGTISNNTALAYGGGVYIAASTSNSMNVTAAKISGNAADISGGGIYTLASTTFIDSEISGNTAFESGGGIYASAVDSITLTGTTVSGNSLTRTDEAPSRGAGIYASARTTTLTNTTVKNNFIENPNTDIHNKAVGGGLTVGSGTAGAHKSLTLNGTTLITENRANANSSGDPVGQHGQPPYLDPDCESGYGGGMFVGAYVDVTVADTVDFTLNKAGGCGGGIYVGSNSSLNLGASKVSQNMAGKGGGGIYADYDVDSLTLTGTIVSGNSLTNKDKNRSEGAGIYTGARTTTLNDVLVSGNFVENPNASAFDSAVMGGGLYVRDGRVTAHRSLTLKGTTLITENRANANLPFGFGGGLYVEHYVDITVADTVDFTSNKAGTDGGGIYVIGSSLNLGASKISQNTAGRDGGGIYSGYNLDNNLLLTLTNTTVSGNSLTGNRASHGAGIYTHNRTTRLNGVLISGNFIENDGTAMGGGIYVVGGNPVTHNSLMLIRIVGKVNSSSILITGNRANTNSLGDPVGSSGYGGGLYVESYVDVTMADATDFILNKAGTDGGGIYVAKDSPIDFGNSLISKNTAGRDGGGIWTASSVSFGSTEVLDNASGGDGGAIWVSSTNLDKVSVANGATFSGNTAKRYAISVAPADMVTYNAKIGVPNGAWSVRPDISVPFKRGYNNYDIAYTRTILTELPKNFEKTVSSGNTFRGVGDDVTYRICLDLPTDLTGYEGGIIVYDALPNTLTLTSAAAKVTHDGGDVDLDAQLSKDTTAGASTVKLTLDGAEIDAYKGDNVTITVNAKVNESWTSGNISNKASWYLVSDGTDVGGETPHAVITPETIPPPPTSVNFTVFHYRVDSSDRVVATESETKTGVIGSTVTAATKTYVGYTFNANHVGTVRSGTVLEDGSLVLKLYYEVKTFTVTFRDYNGKTIKKQSVEYGKNATAPPKPSRQGYTFTGWDKAKFAWQNVKSNVVVTATYKATPTVSKPATFTVIFRDHNGRVISKQRVEEGKSATQPADPQQNGHTFAGWDKASSTWQIVKGNIVVTATYRPNKPPNPPTPPTPPVTTDPVDTGGGGGSETTVIVNEPPQPVETTPNDADTGQQVYDDITVITPGDGTTPLASNDSSNKGGSWSLFDLICTIIAVVVALIATIIFAERKREEDDENARRRPVFLLLALLLAVVAIVLFVLTQDMTLPMSIFDRWSIIFAICALVGILSSCLASGRKREAQTD